MNRTLNFSLAALFLLGTAAAVPHARTPASPPAASSKVFITAPLGDVADQKVTLRTGPVPKGITVGPHSHPGPVFAYILEGDIENQVEPDPPATYHAGDFFYEPAMHVHRLLRNLSSTETVRLLIFTIGGTGKVGQAPGPDLEIKTLLEERADVANREGRLSVLTLPPAFAGAGRAGVGPHQHPGPIFAYIVKGAIESQVDPDPVKAYRAGDVFYEPQMHAHRLFRNLSTTEPAELVLLQIGDTGKPYAMPVL